MDSDFRITGSSRLEPNPARLVRPLRAIGYSIENAISDIVDNSLAAHANTVLIRLEVSDDTLERVFIADNGEGMTPDRLEEAMRFGSETEQDPESLGKYGMGLKLASLSQGETLTVLTRRSKRVAGRRWTVEGIGDQWRNDIIAAPDVERDLNRDFGHLSLEQHGTVVIWSDLDRIHQSKRGAKGIAENLLHRLRRHLGLFFHRFIEDERVRLLLDARTQAGGPVVSQTEVLALNPFEYDAEGTGHEEYPKTFAVSLPNGQRLELNSHVWPPNSESASYKLDGKVAARQGLYFYRNDRLIQAGGWNDGKDAAEPHLSLARVAIDLPTSLDNLFSLDVKKSGIREPVGFADALRKAKAADGTVFTDYRSAATAIYRSGSQRDPRDFPLIPGRGLAKELRAKLREVIVPRRSRTREVHFEWDHLTAGSFFEIDRDKRIIRLNVKARQAILSGGRSSAADAPIVKLLLFFILEPDFDSNRVSKAQKERLEKLDRSLAEVIRFLR